ncbi:11497_t:CDS:10 [Funneliformis geosporum]|nr:11497_t:CDS:10 [Funneliformis geosporum]
MLAGVVVLYISKHKKTRLANKSNGLEQTIEAEYIDKKVVQGLPTVKEKKPVKSSPKRIKSRLVKKTSGQACNGSGEQAACCSGNGEACCKNELSEESPCTITKELTRELIKIFYGTQTRTAKYFAQQLYESFLDRCECSMMDIINYETEDFLSESAICIFIISTYNVEGPLDWFYKWLEDTRYDFRVDKQALSKMRFAVFGLGDSAYGEQFCTQPRNIDKWLGQLGAKRLYPLGEGDKGSDQEKSFESWQLSLVNVLFDPSSATNIDLNNQIYDSFTPKLQSARKSKEEEEFVNKNRNGQPKRSLIEQETPIKEPKEMVTPMLRKSLTKQGYKVVGSHSGVKICRWTKSVIGVLKQHQVWPVQTNVFSVGDIIPTPLEFIWKVDPPEMIFSECLDNHYKMIKQMKGVPGIRADRFQEAFNVRHCALSLVGEPILYPHINEFVKLLHDKHISSFLVCNAQHPSRLRALDKVTQLYVSVDASTKESLKKIDRPLFKDFWERFLECLDILSQKGQRTVYRLTLVKDYNTEEIANYVELVGRGKPDFIEVKGVTYCGYGGASKLTMANVPYHSEVISFVDQLNKNLGETYEVAAEHSHSCSILIANSKFKINNQWHTWIDYDKFFELLESGEHFTSLDYVAPTPDWALFGSPEAGFNPEDQRFYRKSKKNNNSVKNGGC